MNETKDKRRGLCGADYDGCRLIFVCDAVNGQDKCKYFDKNKILPKISTGSCYCTFNRGDNCYSSDAQIDAIKYVYSRVTSDKDYMSGRDKDCLNTIKAPDDGGEKPSVP